MQDVDNLAWKLALVLKGNAPETLLESYQTERLPAQQLNQQVTDATMLFMAPPDHFRRLLREAILRLSAFFPPRPPPGGQRKDERALRLQRLAPGRPR